MLGRSFYHRRSRATAVGMWHEMDRNWLGVQEPPELAVRCQEINVCLLACLPRLLTPTLVQRLPLYTTTQPGTEDHTTKRRSRADYHACIDHGVEISPGAYAVLSRANPHRLRPEARPRPA